ncbi:MAG TPA: ABC transporter substrate-binding protein [Gaiellaceae bacterium]|jgi:peptide/nickel transport system substrate-binding protein|nr:ABC transporter substrate-binding protein [Gaiellaceae bacterium]
MSWRVGALSSVVALVVIALGAGAGQSAFSGPSATTLVDGTTDTVTNLDPAGSYDYGTQTLMGNVYEHLLDFKHGPKLEPSLATKCYSVGTLAVWRCNLRRGVQFSDGSAFDSADVKFSFDRVSNKTIVKEAAANSPSSLFGNLKSVTTNGKYAVTFRLKSPQATWPSVMATQAAYIVSSDTYEPNHLRSNSESQVGTGHYVLTKYSPGQQAVFVKNDKYWGTPAKSDNLIIRYYSKSSTMKLALQRGEIDMSYQSFTPNEITSLQKQKGVRVYNGAGGRIRYLVMNVTRPPANNVAVRRAVAYLMPRQTIAGRVYHGQVKPLFSMVPAGYPGHIDAFAARYGRTPSPAKAKAALTAAGLDTPLPIEIWYTPTHYGDSSADEYAEIKRSLERGGVFSVTLKSSEWAQYSSVLGNQYNVYQLGWFPDYPDSENYLVPFYRSDTFTANGYNSPAMEKLIKAELASKSLAQRIRVIKAIQVLAAKDVPIVPYWQQSMIAVARNNVRGIPSTLDPTVLMRFWLLSKS